MKLPKFITKNENPTPPWMTEMDEGDSISCNTTYVMGGFWDKFDECFYPCEEKGDIRYFMYNPIKYGASPDKKYPVLMWIHGLNCAIDGRRCVGYCGAEQYASENYQSTMGGGAFIIVPLANEARLEDDTIVGSWDEGYLPHLKAIYDIVCAENAANISDKFMMGASSGGWVTWRMLENHPDYFTGGIPIASGYVPTAGNLKKIEDAGIYLLVAHGRHDEMAPFNECIEPRRRELSAMNNCICFFPEWVRNEDKGVASVNYGMEMGQHCLINQIQANLMYNDGTCYDERLKDGVTGWIKEVCEKRVAGKIDKTFNEM